MRFLYCDESNLEEKSGDFFTYAGIVVDAAASLSLSNAIDDLRERFKVAAGTILKFNPRPSHLTHNEFRDLKQAIIEAAAKHGVQLICSFILHDLASSPDEARLNEINRICLHFNSLLGRHKDHGMVLIDRFTDKQIDAHLVERFLVGLHGLPFKDPYRLTNIIGFHYSVIGQSHFATIVDVVLGSLRYAVNAFTRGEAGKMGAASNILKILSPLFYRTDETKKVSDLSLFFSPKVIRVQKYFERYSGLHGFLAAQGVEPEQVIAKG